MADFSARLDFILSLTDKVSAPLGKLKTRLTELADQGQQSIARMGTNLDKMAGSGAAITQSLQPALEMNRALGELSSLGVAGDALESLNRKALAFSMAYGTSAVKFVASAYNISGAIKGLTGEQLVTFTNTSNLLAKATKSDAETMSAYIGTLYRLFSGQADAMGKGQWVEQLGGQTALAVRLFHVGGQQLNDAFKALGTTAASAGVSMAEQFAVIGSLSNTLGSGDTGGLYKAFFENLGTAAEKTGLTFTDTAGKALPIMQILDKLQGKYGDLTTLAAGTQLTDAFGGPGAQVIGALAKDTDRLRGSLAELGNVRGLDQAEKMARAMVDPWQQFGAAVQALSIAFGQVLIPILTPLMDGLVSIASTLTRWIQMFPTIAQLIGLITLGFLGLGVAIGAVAVISGVISVLALLVSPITLVGAGIAALVVGVGIGILYWDRLKASFGDTAWFQALLTMITPVILAFRVMGAVLNVLWVGLQQVLGFGLSVIEWLARMFGVTQLVSNAWAGFIWSLTNLSPFALIGSALKGLIALLNKIPGISIDANFGDIPKPPEIPGTEGQLPSTPAVDRALQSVWPGKAAGIPQGAQLLQRPAVMTSPQIPLISKPLAQVPSLSEQAELTRQRMNAAAGSLSPMRPGAVPQGGLFNTIQNTTNNQPQDKGVYVENLNLTNTQPMTNLELENMIGMAVGG